MSKRVKEHKSALLSKCAVPLLLAVGVSAGGIAYHMYSIIQDDKELGEKNAEIMQEQLALLEEKDNEIADTTPTMTEEVVEEVVEEPPREYYSSEYLDCDYSFSDWNTFNQVKLLGIKDMDFDEVLEKYPDIVGGIEIPGTNIKNLIVRSSNDNRDYYLHNDLNGNYFYDGIVYQDNIYPSLEEPQYDQSSVMTIYGHNLNGYTNTGATTRLQFHDLENYLGNQKYADEHNKAIIYYTDGTVAIGDLYSVVRFVRDDSGMGFINPNVNDAESYYQFADLLGSLSEIKTDVYPNYEEGDQLISFQTCSHRSEKGLMLVTFRVPRVKQITCEEQRYLLDDYSNENISETVQARSLSK